jgi:hypothetical protein
MKRFLGVLIPAVTFALMAGHLQAADPKVEEILSKAIKAQGGEEKLSKAQAATWKTKGKLTIQGNENDMSVVATVQGLDQFYTEFEGDFGGNKFKGITVLNGDKGWRKFGDMVMEMDADAVSNEKRMIYLGMATTNPTILKAKGFKLEPAADDTVDGKPAVGLKVTGPDGKDFTIHFDKESGLPVKQVAKVSGWMGDEYTQEALYGDYKDFNGIKKATKLTLKRDGDEFVKQEITEFKCLEKVPTETFAEPK